MRRGEDAFQAIEHLLGYVSAERPLLSKAEHVLFYVGIRSTFLELPEFPNLLVGYSGPPTEGLVIVPSDVAVGELSHLEVGKLS